ncbi:UDP-D-galactose:(glucosyl)lipopolysaccharide-1,6-D-galactosyltransferase [Serratia proteamaculans]|uniref:glycosyltransferase family 4 protein n=1 Tax=Serratia proteamaculans TaxID=28151 RepID=UPI00101EEB5C|nr:glycosyltransferase family 4 protein [Serratia proteamaculans]RYM51479.1 glycosyl transferase family 1 [Serratia proteamaculans]CAI2444123.1 UDP-D-galactose:(glucosyl)lipopolysaccharide-1,6-D-galactosyltransferase [Serratia proteamaculans]
MDTSSIDNSLDDIGRFAKDIKESKVHFIFPSKFTGGHEIMAIEIIKKLYSHEYINAENITCVVPEVNSVLQEILISNAIKFSTFKSNGVGPEFLHALFNPFYLYRCVKINKDSSTIGRVILVQGDILQGVGFLIAGKYTSKRVTSYIPYAHSFTKMGAKFALFKDFVSKIPYKICEEYITISECFRKEIKIKNNKANVSIIHNFVDNSQKKFIKRKLTKNDAINIFIVGRIQFHQKGHDILLKALMGIVDYKIVLHVVGTGPDLHALEVMAKELPGNITVKFHGWVSDSWEIAYDNNIDLLVIPSLFEGVPLVMLEALERKVAIIAAARDGMLDYLPVESLYEIKGEEVTALRAKITYHIQKRLA